MSTTFQQQAASLPIECVARRPLHLLDRRRQYSRLLRNGILASKTPDAHGNRWEVTTDTQSHVRGASPRGLFFTVQRSTLKNHSLGRTCIASTGIPVGTSTEVRYTEDVRNAVQMLYSISSSKLHHTSGQWCIVTSNFLLFNIIIYRVSHNLLYSFTINSLHKKKHHKHPPSTYICHASVGTASQTSYICYKAVGLLPLAKNALHSSSNNNMLAELLWTRGVRGRVQGEHVDQFIIIILQCQKWIMTESGSANWNFQMYRHSVDQFIIILQCQKWIMTESGSANWNFQMYRHNGIILNQIIF